MTTYALVIAAGAPQPAKQVDLGYDVLTGLYRVLECSSVDVVHLTEHVDMWVDDEALLADKPVMNPTAMYLASALTEYALASPIYGAVALTGTDDAFSPVSLSPHGMLEVLSTLPALLPKD